MLIGVIATACSNETIKTEEVIQKKEKQNNNGTADYSYTLKLKISDGQSSEIFEKNGQLSFSNDGALKITRDWEDHVEIEDAAI
ncbi:hypothetical protein [Niallia sp. NCCP-28]|uniref:hypothetical protein n=1 Tax=Niallia sp. NCCP-28 TaxID=2934712 RepID=UPI00208536EC|nr:hypothetical protein [Niallia sp. NCCP-28]GKU81498.1 hypothetical protein NCCP28_08940 [Niallia sp. NCCP-28]